MFAHFLIRPVWIVAALLAAGISLIRAQPYDDGGIAQLLVGGCTSLPCWQGIRPGHTTGPEALAIMQQLGPVRELGSRLDSYFGQIFWRWSADSSRFLNPQTRERAYVWLENGAVRTIYLPGFQTFADVSLLLGRPEQVIIYTDATNYARYVAYLGVYPGQTYLSILLTCDADADDLWNAPANVYIGDQPDYVNVRARTYERSELRGWLPPRLCQRRR
ncbi:MAG: hypothetical protein K8J31_21660 [Anaerolineae bacterium]|nr:hypothetical protein [Anaerolineae bacterium]